jgi:hypothetical protein
MADEHQTNAIIATAVLDSFRGHSDHKLDPEEAKIIAKRILAALEDAGLQITLSFLICKAGLVRHNGRERSNVLQSAKWTGAAHGEAPPFSATRPPSKRIRCIPPHRDGLW